MTIANTIAATNSTTTMMKPTSGTVGPPFFVGAAPGADGGPGGGPAGGPGGGPGGGAGGVGCVGVMTCSLRPCLEIAGGV
jgi:hypothetical protein